MKNLKSFVIGTVALLGLMLLSASLYTVQQTQYAVVFELGKIVDVKTTPGLHFKVPFIQNVTYFDSRIITLDSPDTEKYNTKENNYVVVDSFVKWRIIDPKQYYISVGGDEVRAQNRLQQTITASLKEEFTKRTVIEVVSGERDKIMDIMRVKADEDARRIGVQVIDVRLKRVELDQAINDDVYRRMISERKRVANEIRASGGATSEKIRADADRQKEIILAQAYRDAQRIKGEGDAKASSIYASAYGQNPEFYSFYRSLEAYKQSFKSKSDVLLLEPNSEFFKYLKSSNGKAGK